MDELTASCPRCDGSGAVPAADGPTLRRLRLEANLSQTALAERLGVKQSLISEAETGKATLTDERAARWQAECRRAANGIKEE